MEPVELADEIAVRISDDIAHLGAEVSKSTLHHLSSTAKLCPVRCLVMCTIRQIGGVHNAPNSSSPEDQEKRVVHGAHQAEHGLRKR